MKKCIFILVSLFYWFGVSLILREYLNTYSQGQSQEFLFGGPSYNNNIFIKTTLHMHIYTCFLLYTLFYLISYIYTHSQKKKKKKNLVFSIKIMFDGNLS